MQPEPSVRLLVIAPESRAPYSGMLPGFLAGLYAESELFLDVAALTEQAGGWFLRAELQSIDAERQRLVVKRPDALGGTVLPEIAYDLASINTGAAPRDAFPSAHPNLYYVKPLTHLLQQLPAIDSALTGQSQCLAVIGGGAAGIELAMAFRVRFPEAKITLVVKHPFERDQALAKGATQIEAALDARGVSLWFGEVVEATASAVIFADGQRLDCACVLVATPVAPPQWLSASTLPVASSGFLAVDTRLRVVGYPSLFAAGDVVELSPPRARAGVLAVRAGEYLAKALPAALKTQTVGDFKPQKQWLTLLNCGDGEAILIRGNWSFRGGWVWRLKDWIDRQFMQRFQVQPMQSTALMRCEGCAAKLPGDTLKAHLGGMFEDAAVTESNGQLQMQSIDGLSYLVSDPHAMGWLAVRHAASDLWAMGGQPQTALALVAVARAARPELEADEFRLVEAGIRSAAEAYGIRLIGGHTVALQQPMVAVMVSGSALRPIRKHGAKAGDVLVLSGPIGSGILLAGFRQGLVSGAAIDGYLRVAWRSLGAAADAALHHPLSAMTDVTGFGLAGHIAEMLEEGDLSVRWAASIPTYSGVDEALAAGIRSSAADGNQRYAGAVAEGAPSPVVFDPQTAGPLLAAIPASDADALISAWRATGASPVVVGVITTETS